jgi:thiamine pyrophosphokinase
MRALVVANGEAPSQSLLRELADEAELVIGADGGTLAVLAAHVEPDVVTGDLDSLDSAIRAHLGPDRLVLDANPDRTDLQKAIDLALARGAKEVTVVGFGGARADHALANLSVLVLYRGICRMRLVDDLFEICLVDGQVEFEAEAGTVVSLVALGRCEGVTTRGLRWDLEDYPLAFSPYGVHNEVVRNPATVSVREGDLLLFKGRFVEHHA